MQKVFKFQNDNVSFDQSNFSASPRIFPRIKIIFKNTKRKKKRKKRESFDRQRGLMEAYPSRYDRSFNFLSGSGANISPPSPSAQKARGYLMRSMRGKKRKSLQGSNVGSNRVQGIPRVEHWKWSFYTKVLHITLFKIYPLARPFQPPTRLVHFVATHLAPRRPASIRLVLPFLSSILACSSVLLYRRLSLSLSLSSPLLPLVHKLHSSNHRQPSLLSSPPFETFCLFIPLSLLNMICLLGIPPCPSREERFANWRNTSADRFDTRIRDYNRVQLFPRERLQHSIQSFCKGVSFQKRWILS